MAAAQAEGALAPCLGADLVWLPNALACIGVAMALYAYALATSNPARLASLAVPLAFQLACWGGGLAVLAARHPRGQLRFSDPAVLVGLWSTLYFLVPSILFVQGAALPYDADLVGDVPTRLFWLHGLFMLSFFSAYVLLVTPRCYIADRVSSDDLVSGWPLFSISFVPLALSVAERFITTGTPFPAQNYGDEFIALQGQIQSARESGGIQYIWVQLASKFGLYPILAAGIGAGLVLARSSLQRKGFTRSLLLVLLGVLAVLFSSNGGRHLAFMILLIGLVTADALAGPVRWRTLAIWLPVALLLFEFMGYFRAYRDLALGEGLAQGFQEFSSGGNTDKLFEYTIMLGKEATSMRLFDRPDGIDHVVGEIVSVIPSQLVPTKFAWVNTADVVSREMLGDFAETGAGVAGTIIGDSYRAAGAIGVAVIGAVLGLALSALQRWAAAGVRTRRTGPILLRVLLVCAFYGWTFDVIRGDLANLLAGLIYDVALIWLLLLWLGSSSGWFVRPSFEGAARRSRSRDQFRRRLPASTMSLGLRRGVFRLRRRHARPTITGGM